MFLNVDKAVQNRAAVQQHGRAFTSVKLVTIVVDVEPESWKLRLASVPIVTSEPALHSLTRAEDMNSARGLNGLDCHATSCHERSYGARTDGEREREEEMNQSNAATVRLVSERVGVRVLVPVIIFSSSS